MLLNSQEFKFLKNYRNLYGKSSVKCEYRDEKALSKLITLLISLLRAKHAMRMCERSEQIL